MTQSLLAAFTLIALAPSSVFAEEEKELPIDQSSPESVAKEFVEAMGERRWERAFRCMTLESQRKAALGAFFPAGAVAGNDEAKNADLYGLLKDHGVKNVQDIAKVKEMTDTKQLAAIFGTAMTWASQNASDDQAKQKLILDRLAAGEHMDFKIEGDRATATFHPQYKKNTRTSHFQKVDGKWYLATAKSAREGGTEAKP